MLKGQNDSRPRILILVVLVHILIGCRTIDEKHDTVALSKSLKSHKRKRHVFSSPCRNALPLKLLGLLLLRSRLRLNMTPPPAKRARTTSRTPPTTASKAIQDAITSLASSSSDLSPDLYSKLLGSLSNAHTKALEQEREEISVKEEQGAKDPTPSSSNEPVELKSWVSTIQGDLKEVERRILEDIDAGMPKLDELVSFTLSSFSRFFRARSARANFLESIAFHCRVFLFDLYVSTERSTS